MGKTLAQHAEDELKRAGMTDNEDPEARKVSVAIIALTKRFEKQDLNQKSATFVLEAFETICNFLPLTPLSTDPEEWDKFSIDRKNIDTDEVEKKIVWQSKRAPRIFSEDEGKTFVDQSTGKVGESVDHIKRAAEIDAEAKDRAERKAAAEARAKNPRPIGHVNPDMPEGSEKPTDKKESK